MGCGCEENYNYLQEGAGNKSYKSKSKNSPKYGSGKYEKRTMEELKNTAKKYGISTQNKNKEELVKNLRSKK